MRSICEINVNTVNCLMGAIDNVKKCKYLTINFCFYCISIVFKFFLFFFYILLELEWKKNAAFQKLVDSSSVYYNYYENWSPQYTTDGLIPNGGIHIFHSEYETAPWIRVDLQQALAISFVRVYMRRDGGGTLFITTFH